MIKTVDQYIKEALGIQKQLQAAQKEKKLESH